MDVCLPCIRCGSYLYDLYFESEIENIKQHHISTEDIMNHIIKYSECISDDEVLIKRIIE